MILDGAGLSIADLLVIAEGGAPVSLSDAAWARIAEARAIVDRLVADRVPVYGVTTGVGSQKDYAVGAAELTDYNARLIRAHATRTPGRELTRAERRATAAIQLDQFAAGHSGVRTELVQALVDRLNADAVPPARTGASVGASDIVAMSQLAQGLPPLAAKEALSLMNSNAAMLAEGALLLEDTRRLLDGMEVAAALAMAGFAGNPEAWSAAAEIRSPAARTGVGARLRGLLAGTGWEPRFLQDPLSLRCVPQIQATCRSALDWAWQVWETELAAPVDNPAIRDGGFVSHGNMESGLPCLVVDALRLALAKALKASGERQHKLHWPAFTGLPTGLAETGGAVGGVQFLNLEHIVAARIGTVLADAQPALLHYRGQVDDGVEDVAGMAPLSVELLGRLLESAWLVVAIEAAIATWACARRGIVLGPSLEAYAEGLRALLPIGQEGLEVWDAGPLIDLVRGWRL